MSTPARPGPRSLLAPWLGVLLAAVLLAGCSSGSSGSSDGEDGPDGGSTGSSESAGGEVAEEPAEPEPTVDIAAPENIDPCESLTPRQWRPFVPRLQRDKVTAHRELTAGTTLRSAIGAFVQDDNPKWGCVLSYPGEDGDPVDIVAWGYYLGKFGPDQVNDLLVEAGGTATDRGYAAITTRDALSVNGYGYHAQEQVGFWMIGRDNLARRFNQLDPEQRERITGQVLRVLDKLSLERDSQDKVMLPGACPSADDPKVRAVIGTVSTARGFDDGLGRIQCLYRNAERDRTLRLTAGPLPQEQVDGLEQDFGKPANRPNRFRVDGGDTGVVITLPRAGSGSGGIVHPDELSASFAAVELGNLAVLAPAFPRQALVDLLTTFDASRGPLPTAG